MKVVGTQIYSFRSTQRVFGTAFNADTPESAALSAIEDALMKGHAHYLAGHYQDAIRDYQRAAALVYAQLHPAGSGGRSKPSRHPELFVPLLSLSLEWMNLLPPIVPIATSRPRVEVTPEMIGEAAGLDRAGLRSELVDAGQNADAIADWQLAKTLTAQSNPLAAQVFLDRAQREAPELIGQLQALPAEAPLAGPPPPHERPQRAASGLAVEADAAPPMPRVDIPADLTVERSYGMVIDEEVKQVKWKVGDAPDLGQMTELLYDFRLVAVEIPLLLFAPQEPSELAAGLPHVYFYVIPLAIAECYHALGDYVSAESEYTQAASYRYLNPTVEAPYLWGRLATLYRDWGDSLFRQGNPTDALSKYANVIMPDDTEPSSSLYTIAPLKAGADIARQVLADLPHIATLALDPDIVSAIAGIRGQIAKINGNLDFWGFWTATVPIWSFDYLQTVAINLAQLAVSVERDVINYWSQADSASLTRQQLVTAASSAKAEVAAATLQVQAAAAQQQAYQAGVLLATQRAQDAHQAVTEYQRQSSLANSYQAWSAAFSGGDNGSLDELNQFADQLLSGQTVSGTRGAAIAAARQLAGAKANQQYEVDSLNRQAIEMDLARVQAIAEVAAAGAQVAAAEANVAVAQIRAQGSQAMLEAFDNQVFSPEVWKRMGDQMFQLYQRYQVMALYVAKLMQRAYNFETDQELDVIRTDYSTQTVNGLLGSDVLLADIESFTYILISSTNSKPQPVKQTISLASRYPYAFETQLRPTGVIDFQTMLDDFDSQYPGTYAGRITAVEVAVDGVVPTTGISGTLTNGGISSYRTPFSSWAAPTTPKVKFRLQPQETQVLSDYQARDDSLLIQPDSRQLRIFEGAGVASTWRLELPKEINDIDYGALLDVRLTFYYHARFDPQIAPVVQAQLAARPGFTDRQRSLPLRWIYPDAFFSFRATGQLDFTLLPRDFPHAHTSPQLNAVGVLVATDGSVAPEGLVVGLATPATAAPVTATLDAHGRADSTAAGSSWEPLATGAALGSWSVSLTGADNPGLVQGGQLRLTPIVNIAVLMDYTFTPRT
jgi:hypothetical protein